MKKTELFIPIILVFLGIAFVAVSLAVYLSDGKSAFWVSRKMRLGALIITLSSLGACDGCINPPNTCYEQVATDRFVIESAVNDTVKTKISDSLSFNARVSFPQSQEYSFSVVNSAGVIVLREDLFSLDSTIDSTSENFRIKINKKLNKGAYKIQIYPVSQNNQDSVLSISNYNLIISK